MGKSSIAKQFGWGPRSETAIEVGKRVREQRRKRGLTQSELGHPLSRGYMSALESGATLPSLGTVWLLAQRLGVTVGDLIDGANGSSLESYTLVNEPQTKDASTRRTQRARAHHRSANPQG